jgi:hypothetical protein
VEGVAIVERQDDDPVTGPLTLGDLRRAIGNHQPPTVLAEDRHEPGRIPLIGSLVMDAELSYRVHGHRVTLPTEYLAETGSAARTWQMFHHQGTPTAR